MRAIEKGAAILSGAYILKQKKRAGLKPALLKRN